MGLSERRQMAKLREEILPQRTEEVQRICDVGIPFEIDWDSYANDLNALVKLDGWMLERVLCALRVIGQDKIGQEAMREGLKKVRFQNVRDTSEKSLTFADGVLALCTSISDDGEGTFQSDEIKHLLERNL